MNIFILCLKIFGARIIDVSLGTFRTIVLIKGKKILAGIIGFFEVFVWFVIVQEAMNTPYTSIFIALFYSLGFASGTIIGAYLTDYFINSPIEVQIFTSHDDMINVIRNNKFGASLVRVRGFKDDRNMLIVHTSSKRYKKLIKIINDIDDEAFVIVTDTKTIQNGFIVQK